MQRVAYWRNSTYELFSSISIRYRHTLFFTPSFLCCKNQSLLKLFQIMLWVQCEPLFECVLVCLMTQTYENLLFCSLQKPFFLYIKITFIMLGYTTSSWSQVALPTKVGDLIQILFSFIKNINWWFFPILYLCLFLRREMIFPQGKLLSCLRKFWVNLWKLRRTYIFHL